MKYADKLFGVFQRLHRAEESKVRESDSQSCAASFEARRTVWAEAAPDRGATFFFTLGTGAPGEATDTG